ncbi:MAG: hypothetical protein GX597_10775 [Anaerolineaceae bacterium]|nr:hypothetical protein [Anaerolineaceae bacterium]
MSQQEIVWFRHPEAEAYVTGCLDELTAALPAARNLATALEARTSSRLFDWLDHLVLAGGDRPRGQLADLGFEREEAPAGQDSVYHHPGTMLPRVVLREGVAAEPGTPLAAALGVEEVAAFLMANGLSAPIEGSILGPYRRATAWQANGRSVLVVERRGHAGFEPVEAQPDETARYLRALERWATRPRRSDGSDVRAAMEQTLGLAREMVSEMGVDRAAWIVMEAERSRWQRRNRAGQVQKARQDSLGLGWGNHDHHTFRSSRETFGLLIQILETLGFRPRERFYAGAQAGWGAQVMEQPVCRVAIFADVDLSPEEVDGDFAHSSLAPREALGTVGLWCALHGESMLDAGLHHLASRLSFDRATADLADWQVEMMRPFSDFEFLRQAFTRGERWDVAPERLDRLVSAGRIDEEQRARFAAGGAIGSHLENIQRAEGFKGFNQETVSDIIRRTDPRGEIGA